MFQGPKDYVAQICEVHLQYGNSTTKWPFYTFFLVNSPLLYILFSLIAPHSLIKKIVFILESVLGVSCWVCYVSKLLPWTTVWRGTRLHVSQAALQVCYTSFYLCAIKIPLKTRRVKTGLYEDLVINDPGSSVKSEDVILKILFYLSDLIIYATDARKTIVRI